MKRGLNVELFRQNTCILGQGYSYIIAPKSIWRIMFFLLLVNWPQHTENLLIYSGSQLGWQDEFTETRWLELLLCASGEDMSTSSLNCSLPSNAMELQLGLIHTNTHDFKTTNTRRAAAWGLRLHGLFTREIKLQLLTRDTDDDMFSQQVEERVTWMLQKMVNIYFYGARFCVTEQSVNYKSL